MVVIGVIALITTWAVPGVKKAYHDFVFHRSAENLDVLYGSMRAYYLVLNEFPADSNSDLIQKEAVWSIPSNFYKRTLTGTNYYLNIQPYDENLILKFDIGNHFTNIEAIKTFAICIAQSGNKTTNNWYSFLEKRYPLAPKMIYGGATLLCYPEVASQYITDSAIHRNRYY
ncbi:MAG: hypothetical protein ACSW8C_00820 [bacterium]